MPDDLQTLALPAGSGPEELFQSPFQKRLEELLPGFLNRARWFGGKARPIAAVRIISSLPLPEEAGTGRTFIVNVSYRDGKGEDYLVPLVLASDRELGEFPAPPGATLAKIRIDKQIWHLYDAAYDPAFRQGCLNLILRGETLRAKGGEIRGVPGKARRGLTGKLPGSEVLGKEQSNTSFLYGDQFILKLYRRPQKGVNPEVEVTRFLTEEAAFDRIPPFAGMIELRLPGGKTISAAILQGYVPHRDDAWSYTLGEVSRFLNAATRGERDQALKDYLVFARRLGERTAQLHRALASSLGDPAFAPELETAGDRETGRRSARELLKRGLAALEEASDRLDGESRKAGREILARKGELFRKIDESEDSAVTGYKIRIHGDYHLGQLLWTGNDVVIIDFEGEPARTREERRRKRSPLVDVAGMVRSFHYAALGGIFLFPRKKTQLPNDLFSRADGWYRAAAESLLASYRREISAGPPLLPGGREEEGRLLDLCLIEKAAYELNYELNNRPGWAIIPLRGLGELARER